ncbi:GNAT family N-acetyltransferase [Altererythrobacter salegens]|uniref:GNAT family N-acetyltransferase n=1 Tax=Croceibacterium salegens TaxID=1737568 RepID=A0A6I4T2D1_9SPHN|nr:GNAT family N-acetyltransferase [Croceibacterium salegens]MXO60812.1 GNAT family N-acetyltransferase [Croceibacterium salegens]
MEEQRAAHAAELYALLTESALHEFTDSDPPSSAEWLEARFRRLENRCSPDGTQQWLNWVIRTAEGKAAGYVQATVNAEGSAEIAFVLGLPYWGRGLAEMASAQMMDILVRRHGVTRFTATADTRNARSVRLLERLGFKRVGSGDSRDASFECRAAAIRAPRKAPSPPERESRQA